MGVCPHLFSHHNFLRIECELVHCWVGDSLCWSCAAYIKSLHLRAFLDSSGFVISFDFFVLYHFSVWASPDEVQLIRRCGIIFRLHKLYLCSRGASSPVSLSSCFPFEVCFSYSSLKRQNKKMSLYCCFLLLPVPFLHNILMCFLPFSYFPPCSLNLSALQIRNPTLSNCFL